MRDLVEQYPELNEEDIIKGVQLASSDHYMCSVFKVEAEDDCVYLLNSEDANIDSLEEIIQHTLQRHNSNEIVHIAWSSYCSKPITG